jgi:hypothetical protein
MAFLLRRSSREVQSSALAQEAAETATGTQPRLPMARGFLKQRGEGVLALLLPAYLMITVLGVRVVRAAHLELAKLPAATAQEAVEVSRPTWQHGNGELRMDWGPSGFVEGEFVSAHPREKGARCTFMLRMVLCFRMLRMLHAACCLPHAAPGSAPTVPHPPYRHTGPTLGARSQRALHRIAPQRCRLRPRCATKVMRRDCRLAAPPML